MPTQEEESEYNKGYEYARKEIMKTFSHHRSMGKRITNPSIGDISDVFIENGVKKIEFKMPPNATYYFQRGVGDYIKTLKMEVSSRKIRGGNSREERTIIVKF